MTFKSVLKSAAAAFICAAVVICTAGCDSAKVDNTAEITVSPGDTLAEITIQVNEETGKLRFKLFPQVAPEGVNNFIKLAESGYYNGKTIHRVIKDYVIQGGALHGNGTGGSTYDQKDIPRETNERMRAYYGALGYAEGSDGINSQFFIVNNKRPFDIDKSAERIQSDLEEYGDRITEEDKASYADYLSKLNAAPDDVKSKYLSSGGVFQLDGNYTIFGQLIEGGEFLDKISEVEVAAGNDLDDKQGIDSKPTVSITIKKVEIAQIPRIEETEATTSARATRPPRQTSDTADSTEASVPEDGTTADTSAQPDTSPAQSEETAASAENEETDASVSDEELSEGDTDTSQEQAEPSETAASDGSDGEELPIPENSDENSETAGEDMPAPAPVEE